MRPGARRSIAIVGSGPGGLAVAMLLARAGADVEVWEKHDRVGGRSAALELDSPAGRFRFDTGPTFFLYPRVLEDVFATCGRRLRDEVELVRLDPQYRLVFEQGGVLDATADLARMQRELARFSLADAAAFPRFMEENRHKLAAFRPLFERAWGGARDLVRVQAARALPHMRPHLSVDSDLARHFGDERVRLAFSFQSKYLGMSPFRCPSLFTILSFLEYEYGVWHPRGGCSAVMEAMERVARDMGVRFHLGAPVERVLVEKQRVTGLRVQGQDRCYDAVVVNADFATAMRKLVPDAARRRWTDARIVTKRFSCSTFMLYLGMEGTFPGLAHHTIYLASDYRRGLSEIEAGQAPSSPSFYVQNAGATDPSLAPPGHSALYVLVPVGNRLQGDTDWPAIQAHYRELVLDRLVRLGLPDLRSRIRTERVVTPVDWENTLDLHGGATFSLAHSLDQLLYRRPRNRFEDIDGMYLVGSGTHPGSGLPIIFESARIVARVLAEDLGLSVADARTPTEVLDHHEAILAEAL